MLISIKNEEIILVRSEIGGSCRGKLEIECVHPSQNVAFKIKNSCPQLFTVKPTTGVLGPGSSIQCRIKYKYSQISDQDAMKIKFIILSTLTDLNINEQELTEGLWEYLKKKRQDEIQEQIVRLKIEENLNNKRVLYNKETNDEQLNSSTRTFDLDSNANQMSEFSDQSVLFIKQMLQNKKKQNISQISQSVDFFQDNLETNRKNQNWDATIMDHKKYLDQYNETTVIEDFNCSRNDTLGYLETLLNEFKNQNTMNPNIIQSNIIKQQIISQNQQITIENKMKNNQQILTKQENIGNDKFNADKFIQDINQLNQKQIQQSVKQQDTNIKDQPIPQYQSKNAEINQKNVQPNNQINNVQIVNKQPNNLEIKNIIQQQLNLEQQMQLQGNLNETDSKILNQKQILNQIPQLKDNGCNQELQQALKINQKLETPQLDTNIDQDNFMQNNQDYKQNTQHDKNMQAIMLFQMAQNAKYNGNNQMPIYRGAPKSFSRMQQQQQISIEKQKEQAILNIQFEMLQNYKNYINQKENKLTKFQNETQKIQQMMELQELSDKSEYENVEVDFFVQNQQNNSEKNKKMHDQVKVKCQKIESEKNENERLEQKKQKQELINKQKQKIDLENMLKNLFQEREIEKEKIIQEEKIRNQEICKNQNEKKMLEDQLKKTDENYSEIVKQRIQIEQESSKLQEERRLLEQKRRVLEEKRSYLETQIKTNIFSAKNKDHHQLSQKVNQNQSQKEMKPQTENNSQLDQVPFDFQMKNLNRITNEVQQLEKKVDEMKIMRDFLRLKYVNSYNLGIDTNS